MKGVERGRVENDGEGECYAQREEEEGMCVRRMEREGFGGEDR